MHPDLHVNPIAIVAAVAASFVFSFLWHGPLFGKKWAALMGFKKEDCSSAEMKKMMLRGMALSLVGTFLTAFVMIHATNAWRPSVWKAGTDDASYIYGFFSGFFTWLGYYVPGQLACVAWERRNWPLFALNCTYHFLNLQIIGMIVACLY